MEDEQTDYEKEREERRYRDRRERFAFGIFLKLILKEEDNRRDYLMIAKEAIEAADVFEEQLNPTEGPVFPDYEG